MAHYQVMLRARCVAVVEAQSEEEAMNIGSSTLGVEFILGLGSP
ncbi:MAG: hypothetical protein V7756_09740 [Halopseudomonas sp.]